MEQVRSAVHTGRHIRRPGEIIFLDSTELLNYHAIGVRGLDAICLALEYQRVAE